MTIPAIGVFLPTSFVDGDPVPDVAAAATHAEALGFESVWVVDGLIQGNGASVLSSTLVLATAAAVTQRIKLGFGVMVVPFRAQAWIAKDIATLQQLSQDRVILGVGVGSNAHTQSWTAVGVPKEERGKRLDEALRVLPDLIAGKEVDGVRLTPGATVPPILVGGMADAAIRRAKAHDGWIPMPMSPEKMRDAIERHQVSITANFITVAIKDDPTPKSREDVVKALMHPRGPYALTREVAEQVAVIADVEEIAALLRAYADAGAERLNFLFPTGDWHRQAQLLASAISLAK